MFDAPREAGPSTEDLGASEAGGPSRASMLVGRYLTRPSPKRAIHDFWRAVEAPAFEIMAMWSRCQTSEQEASRPLKDIQASKSVTAHAKQDQSLSVADLHQRMDRRAKFGRRPGRRGGPVNFWGQSASSPLT